MKNINSKITKIFFLIATFTLVISFNSFAAKYTIANGKDFNMRIKMLIDKSYTSATPDYSVTAFKYSTTIDGQVIDISEDGDNSVLAYIKNNIIYCVSDDDIYLNEDASYMFDKFVNLKQVDLSFLDFSKTNKTKFMFGNCKYLKEINFDGETILKLNEIEGMFFDCQSVVDLNLFMFNTKNVRSMNSLFFNCRNLKNIYIDPNNWSVKNTTNFNKTYFNCALLKTNFGTRATDIDESKYKTFSIAGDEDKEGLLKDIDYDYDDYGERSGSWPVDKINETLVLTSDNKNNLEYISKTDIQNSLNKSQVNISTSSEFYEYHSNGRIGKDGKVKLSDWLITQTVDEVPILKEETTFVDKLIPKRKNKSSDSIIDRIVDEEISTASDVNGILRPDYSFNEELEEEVISEDEQIDTTTKTSEVNLASIAIIIIGCILVVLIGILGYYFKNKQDNEESWS